MGSVDQNDQVRNGQFSFETKHRTFKWTLKFEEVLRGFARTQAYNIHRHLHPPGSAGHLGPSEWFLELIAGMLRVALTDGSVVTRAARQSPAAAAAAAVPDPIHVHTLQQMPEGSKGLEGKRRAQGRCRSPACVRSQKGGKPGDTTYSCVECAVYLHPGICFERYHSQDYTDGRKLKPNVKVAGAFDGGDMG